MAITITVTADKCQEGQTLTAVIIRDTLLKTFECTDVTIETNEPHSLVCLEQAIEEGLDIPDHFINNKFVIKDNYGNVKELS